MSGTDDLVAKLAEVSPLVLLKALTAALEAQPNFCIHCGYNTRADTVVTRDGFVIDVKAGWVTYQDRYLKLAPAERSMLYTLAYNNRRRSSARLLAERCCPQDGSEKNVRTHLTNLRKALKRQGAPVPFKNQSGIGYYWSLGS